MLFDMTKTALILLLSLTSICSFAQAPHIQWQKCLGGTGFDMANYIVQTSDSGYIVAGSSASANGDVTFNHGGYDFWVAKLTGTGSITWQRSYGGSLGDNANFIQQTTDGGYIVAGVARSGDGDLTGNHGTIDYWVLKLTSTGSIAWQHNYGGSGADVLHCIRQTSDGGYILAGRTASADGDVTSNQGGDDVWIVKLNSLGSITWQKTYGGTGNDDAGAVWEAFDGGFIVAGNTGSNDGDVSGNHGLDDIWVMKLSSSGSLLWQKCYGGTGTDDMVDDAASGAMQQTSDSGIILAGWSNSNNGDVSGNHGNLDYWVVRLSDTGRIIWQHSFGGSGLDFPGALEQTTDTGFIVTGSSTSNDGDVTGNKGSYDYWTIKLSPSGVLQWEKSTGGDGGVYGESGNSVHETFDGGYIIAGGTNSNDSDVSGNHGDYDYWIVKLFNPITLGINSIDNIPAISITPNPSSGQLFIKGNLSPVDIKICSITGRLLKDASHTDRISIADLPAGMYFVTVVDEKGMLLKQDKVVKQ
jgi:hypothetical protein